jgi:protein-tyrosine-phosphatase
MGAERKEQRLKPKVVLFVCTGNYYRSRFAELLFNSSARRERLGWQTISRGLELNVQNVGPISPHVCSGLRARGVELEYAGLRSPLPLALGDLLSADRVVALKRDEHPTAPRSPWQNGHVERLIGSIRRESLDHLIVFGKAHLRRILKAYSSYYNEVRTHLSLDKDAPEFRRRQKIGRIAAIPILGGLHHQYVRV